LSKRYGRNQKRAHRTRIAELEAEVRALKTQNTNLFHSNRNLGEEIDCAKRIVGEYCVAFKPRNLTMSFRQTDFATVMQHENDFNSGVSRYWDFRQDPFVQTMRVEQIRLPIMCALAERDSIRGSRHVVTTYDGKAYGYAIDAMAWHTNRYPEVLCRNIAERLTMHIYEELQKTNPRGERRAHTRDEPEPRISAPRFEFPGLPDFLR